MGVCELVLVAGFDQSERETYVDGIGRVKCQDIALCPCPVRLKPLAKLNGGAAQLGPGVGAACLAACQDLLGLGEVSGPVSKEERPEVNILGNIEWRKGGRIRHCGQLAASQG